MPETHLSAEAHERLATEVQDLKTRGRIDIARQIEAARALGDLSENGDYHAAKDAQGKMEARIRQLEAMLDGAVIVEPSTGSSAVVEAGSIVGLRYEGDDDIERCLIGSIEVRREDLMVVSPGSPLGLALVGHKVGDSVSYEAPNGQLSVEIVSLD
jgi:transcription elongation factor GreA